MVLVLLGVLLAAGVVVLVLRKRLRARRRRRGTDARRLIAGAWHETIDQLYEAGLVPAGELDALTGDEIAASARRRFPAVANHVKTIGGVAEHAAFHTSVAVLDADAVHVWEAQTELRRALARSLPLGQRLALATRYHHDRRRSFRRRAH